MVKALISFLLIFSSLAMAESKTYNISGMHCEDCRKNIEAEVCKLPGIDTCKVDLGHVTLMSQAPLDDSKIKRAVEAAGHYKVAGVQPVAESIPAVKKPTSK
jgi:mercuric ion binding protein